MLKKLLTKLNPFLGKPAAPAAALSPVTASTLHAFSFSCNCDACRRGVEVRTAARLRAQG